MPTASVNGATLAYTDDGPRDAPAILFSHSLFFNSSMFASQASHFADRYRVVCYDHRGQGGSSRAPRELLDMDTLADDAAGLVGVLGLGPVHVVGNSMGGFVALRLAARRPELLRSATILGSSGGAEGQVAAFDPLATVMLEQGTEPVIDTLMHIMFGDDTLADPERADEVGRWRQFMLGLDRGIGDCAWQVIHRRAVLPELEGCRVPVLAVAGAQDHAYSVTDSQAVVDRVVNGRLAVVERAGHSIAVEQPAEVVLLLEEHIGGL